MKFTKMQGCGNDYVYINGFEERIESGKKPELVRRLSNRNYGIGSDGVIFINPSEEADFEMEMYNADGSRSQMCGNGIRCVGKYVFDKGLTNQTTVRIASGGSIKVLELSVKDCKVDTVRVNMGEPVLRASRVPVIWEQDEVVDGEIEVNGRAYRMTCVSMGNPHAVVFVEDLEQFPLEQEGPLFEHHQRFPQRVNTEFVKVTDEENVSMRVWERGTGETLACGTGACAVAVACILNGHTKRKLRVHLLGGDLDICWDETDNCVYMTGEALTVFEGEIADENL